MAPVWLCEIPRGPRHCPLLAVPSRPSTHISVLLFCGPSNRLSDVPWEANVCVGKRPEAVPVSRARAWRAGVTQHGNVTSLLPEFPEPRQRRRACTATPRDDVTTGHRRSQTRATAGRSPSTQRCFPGSRLGARRGGCLSRPAVGEGSVAAPGGRPGRRRPLRLPPTERPLWAGCVSVGSGPAREDGSGDKTPQEEAFLLRQLENQPRLGGISPGGQGSHPKPILRTGTGYIVREFSAKKYENAELFVQNRLSLSR